jgi:hypothetical protein
MLAGIEKAFHAGERFEVIAVKADAKNAIDTLLAGLIDYAGLYPPASLDVHSALDNYRQYRRGKHASALGRFIVDLNKMDELRPAAGNLRDLKLSAILAQPADADRLRILLEEGMPIEAVEFKAAIPEHIEQMARLVGPGLEIYVEIPVESMHSDLLQAISAVGARAKLRTGGIVAGAFPPPIALASSLRAILKTGLAFKATAGLHHPLRSRHRLAYTPDSPSALMHGFINLIGAVALLHSGAEVAEVERALDDQDPAAWRLTSEALEWRAQRWNHAQLGEVRKTFVSFGSCSFEEPIRDLETLGWL